VTRRAAGPNSRAGARGDFNGAPSLEKATDTLRQIKDQFPASAAAIHATVSLTSPSLHAYKMLRIGEDREDLTVQTRAGDFSEAASEQVQALTKDSDRAADTLGNIRYFSKISALSRMIKNSGDRGTADKVRRSSLTLMRKRKIRPELIEERAEQEQ
jgi:hypothetical protein